MSYIKPVVNTLLAVVAVGKATPFASKSEPHVIEREVPLSFILNINFWKLVGVPDKLVVILVILVARAVIVTYAQLSEFIVGVALETIVVTASLTIVPDMPPLKVPVVADMPPLTLTSPPTVKSPPTLTSPFKYVSVISSFPSVTVLLPAPTAPFPITVSFVSPPARAFVSEPIKVLYVPVSLVVVPSVI